MEIWKGQREKIEIVPWIGAKGGSKCRVSIGSFYLTPTGEYRPTGKSFALSSSEARETAAGLLEVANLVDAENARLEEELIQQGKA